MQVCLQGEILELLPEKALWLPEYRMLVLADLHIGKITHFRKAGIYMPPINSQPDLLLLQQLVDRYKPESLTFLGDLFHSQANSEWLHLKEFLAFNQSLNVMLIRGNHDILPDHYFSQSHIDVLDELQVGNLLLTHQPISNPGQSLLNIAGHIHPGYLLQVPGRQYYKLSCFYWQEQTFLLPAFGRYTGLYLLKKDTNSKIYVIAGEKVLAV
ncbi:putative phosphoesterase [bacterium A37T11]|nr:putative phosphoesterase [bacterium A37T11]